ncbi:hypothetical protein JAB5_52310 [Janthinobacterium sp. HH103]|uniref:cyclophilin-like fold protein n=1 Tax=unclassified Janthinobacterium TaxID=2610881 RepID=UPI000893B5F9|nr:MULTISPECIES: cyclophilin-like fold protein [unclassified Janthinobacterium]OEZ67885.1 hypothetical protein JAB5_52310 [Janthinobacterium sp. HH103]OEZ70370.1 hypothetical protein JAB2_09890 [Janthinobacterium sp. HH100]QOU75264.1 Cyclophilin-like family protein [Janthinobacterium sp. HH102]
MITCKPAVPTGTRHGLGLLLGLLSLGAWEARQQPASVPYAPVPVPVAAGASLKPERLRLSMRVGERRFAVTLSDNATGHAFAAMLPLTLDMAELNGNEKHADLAKALPVNASRPGTIRNGDLMLYGTKTVVVFYKTFTSPYAYSAIGRVADPEGLAQALGRHGAQVEFIQYQSIPGGGACHLDSTDVEA